MKKICILFLSVILLTSCRQSVIEGVESSIYDDDNVQQVKVTNNNASIRSGCSNNASVLQNANQNETYKVLNKVSDWYAVKLPDQSIGFIPQSQCKAIIDESKPVEVPNNVQRTPAQQKVADPNTTKDNKTDNTANRDKSTKDNTVNNKSLTEDEQQMLDLVNQERKANNLQPLKADIEVTNVARIKSQDMIDNNYFSHHSPTYGSPFDMLKSFNVHYVAAGENIAGNQTVQAAHDALMNSPGHRANILKAEYTHIGIGIIDGGSYGKMFTQLFTSKPK